MENRFKMAAQVVFVLLAMAACVHAFGNPSPNCGSTVGCLSYPPNCAASNSCNMTLMYWRSESEDKVTFEARAIGDWVGVGINTDRVMIGATGEICQCEGGACSLSGFIATTRERPTQFPQRPLGITDISISQTDGEILCKFTRSVQMVASYMRDLNVPHHYQVAAGPVSFGVIQYHRWSKFSSATTIKASDFTEDMDEYDTNTILAITLPLGILIVLLLLGFAVYLYARKRSQGQWARQQDDYTAGWKYPGRLQPYGYSYRHNPDIYGETPPTLDNYSDEMYRKFQANEGYHGDVGSPPKQRVDPDAEPFNKFFKDAQKKNTRAHHVYF